MTISFHVSMIRLLHENLWVHFEQNFGKGRIRIKKQSVDLESGSIQ